MYNVFVVFSAIGVPDNLMTIVVLVYFKHLRSKLVNIFIINQSAIDALVCLVKLLGQVTMENFHILFLKEEFFNRIYG